MNEHSTRFIVPRKAVNPSACRVLTRVDQAMTEAGVRYFVAGAMARDLMLVHVFGFAPARAVRDIDLGISLANWAQLEALKLRLENRGFAVAAREAHRLYWNDRDSGVSTPVDLVPFGGVASPDKRVAWPPSHDALTNVAGFEEALEGAVQLRIAQGVTVPVASIPALAVLKLLAWRDRHTSNLNDAADLWRLLTCYANAGNIDRLNGDALPLLEQVNNDLEAAGARLLGLDAARCCQNATRFQVGSVLAERRAVNLLISQIDEAGSGERAERIAALVDQFSRGFLAAELRRS